MSASVALVTGAAGFIGSHLCRRLTRDGWQVRGVDCFTPYYDPALKERNLTPLQDEPRFELIRVDLRTADLKPLLDGVEVVWHLAAQAGVRSSWGSSFDEYTSLNINATQRLLEAMVGRPPRRIVCASSSSVYGEAPVFPMTEDGPLRPISPYGVTKLAAEHLARLYALSYALPTVSLRYFTVYGPRQRPDMGFHRFFKAILSHEPLPVYGDGGQTRDFTFIDDVIEANVLAAEKGEPGESYNISGGSRVTVLEVIREMEAIVGREARIEYQPKQKGDPTHTGGDSSKARSRLGYEPMVSLSDGLARMAAWMRRYLEGAPE
jgi:nucleoside-diphosphate-sugar epimerase